MAAEVEASKYENNAARRDALVRLSMRSSLTTSGRVLGLWSARVSVNLLRLLPLTRKPKVGQVNQAVCAP